MTSRRNGITLENGNAITLLKQLDDESIDCIATDPPYPTISGGTSNNKDVNRPGGILSKNDGKIFKENDIHISMWIHELYRVLKDDKHIYIMVNFSNLAEYMKEIEDAGFKIHNLLVWEKNNATPNRWYMKNCEYIIFARKGSAIPIHNCGSKTVLNFNSVKDRIHPTEKPVDLMELLITNSTEPNDIVLDPFSGSGATLIASLKSGRKAIGYELDGNYYELASERLSNFNNDDIKIIQKPVKRLTDNQAKILDVLKSNPNKDYTGKELSLITNIPSRSCSGCITPLVSSGYAIKTNTKSPFKIKLKEEPHEI